MNKFLMGYLDCALWSSTDEDDEPMDKKHRLSDLSNEALEKAKEDCKAFQEECAEDLKLYYQHRSESYAGHDFWLTRNRHGAGFWDRGLDQLGVRLTDAAHRYGECYLYIGDDGQLYFS
jgi:hypothetical protein